MNKVFNPYNLIYLFACTLIFSTVTYSYEFKVNDGQKFSDQEFDDSKVLLHSDELVIIQSISGTRKSFVVRKGAIDGVFLGQTSLFTNENNSLLAKAIEVSRQFSLWEPTGEYVTVPFERKEYVIFNANPDAIWHNIEKAKTLIAQKSKYIEDHKVLLEQSFVVKGSFSRGVYESISETESTKTVSRMGYNMELIYNHDLNYSLEFGIGLRMDTENARQEKPALIIPTKRYFVTGEINYYFPKIIQKKFMIYAGLGTGMGTSQTIVNDSTLKGKAAILPSFKIGVLTKKKNSSVALTSELITESIAQREVFSDNHTQTTNIINMKIALGLKF